MSNEVKCNILSVSSITLHLSGCLEPYLGDSCLLMIIGQRSNVKFKIKKSSSKNKGQ